MQSHYDEHIDREMGCTEAEWLRWLPLASGGHAVRVDGAGRCADITISGGCCRLAWTPLPDRQIALMRIPRLAVSFRFDGVDAVERTRFMRHFDLHTQRGGG
ncbi:MAG: hypothetical protein QFE16_00820 [Pseudomonadota bacterium]|nr:hypothetical protein [Pseudomonadota bacterium]